MLFQTIDSIDQNKTTINSLRRKILSQWQFPTNENFQTLQVKRGFFLEKAKINNKQTQINDFLYSRLRINEQKDSLLGLDEEVSQNDRNLLILKKFNTSLYGGSNENVPNKYAIAYKKGSKSVGVSNERQLNVTSFKFFKVRSLAKPFKSKQSNPQESQSIKKALHHTKTLILKNQTFQRTDISKLPNIQTNSSTIKRIFKITPKKEIQQTFFDRFQTEQKKPSFLKMVKKNSISPWDSFLQ